MVPGTPLRRLNRPRRNRYIPIQLSENDIHADRSLHPRTAGGQRIGNVPPLEETHLSSPKTGLRALTLR